MPTLDPPQTGPPGLCPPSASEMKAACVTKTQTTHPGARPTGDAWGVARNPRKGQRTLRLTEVRPSSVQPPAGWEPQAHGRLLGASFSPPRKGNGTDGPGVRLPHCRGLESCPLVGLWVRKAHTRLPSWHRAPSLPLPQQGSGRLCSALREAAAFPNPQVSRVSLDKVRGQPTADSVSFQMASSLPHPPTRGAARGPAAHIWAICRRTPSDPQDAAVSRPS